MSGLAKRDSVDRALVRRELQGERRLAGLVAAVRRPGIRRWSCRDGLLLGWCGDAHRRRQRLRRTDDRTDLLRYPDHRVSRVRGGHLKPQGKSDVLTGDGVLAIGCAGNRRAGRRTPQPGPLELRARTCPFAVISREDLANAPYPGDTGCARVPDRNRSDCRGGNAHLSCGAAGVYRRGLRPEAVVHVICSEPMNVARLPWDRQAVSPLHTAPEPLERVVVRRIATPGAVGCV